MAMSKPKAMLYASVLLISLALNLFLGGLLIGWTWLKMPPPHQDDFVSGNPFEILHAVPEARDKLDPILRRHTPDIGPKLEQMHLARHAIRDQLRQDEVDIDALRTSLTTLRQAEMAMHSASHETFLAIIAELTPAQRQQLITYHARPHKDKDRKHHRPPFDMAEHLRSSDSDNDGQLNYEEFLQALSAPHLERAQRLFKRLDSNQNGVLDKEEIDNF